MTADQSNNLHVRIPLAHVRADALYGVRAAREAWRVRDPEGAANQLERNVEPGQELGQVDRARRIGPIAGDDPRTGKVSKMLVSAKHA
jgi:hypothetical protein